MRDLETYLDEICGPLGSRADEVRRELRQHIEQGAAALEAAGWPREDAVHAAIREFGDPAGIASQLASIHGRGGMQMLRRVMQPMLLAVGVWAGSFLVGALWSAVDKRALDALAHGEPTWTLPVLPDLGWLVFLAVFVAVRLCASRDGSRRECVAVGLSPLVLIALAYAVLIVSSVGLSVLGLFGPVAGFMGGAARGEFTVGTAVMARTGTARLLGMAATCLAATWLHFWTSAHPDRQTVADVS
jgi:hypothetical protein